jgi:hypothetical protein
MAITSIARTTGDWSGPGSPASGSAGRAGGLAGGVPASGTLTNVGVAVLGTPGVNEGVAPLTTVTGVCGRVGDWVGVVVVVGEAIGVWVRVGVGVAVDVGVCVSVGDPTGVCVCVPVGVAVDVGVCVRFGDATGVCVCVPVGVAVDVGVCVRFGDAMGVCVCVRVGLAVAVGVGVALAVAVVVGDGVAVGGGPQGGKLRDFSGLKSGRKTVFVSMRRALASGLAIAVESGPNANVFSSPGRRSTGTVKAPASTGSNCAEPPRDGGMCCISSSGMSSETMASEVLTTVIVPTTPSGPQLASMETMVSGPRATSGAEEPTEATLRRASPAANKRMPGSSRA